MHPFSPEELIEKFAVGSFCLSPSRLNVDGSHMLLKSVMEESGKTFVLSVYEDKITVFRRRRIRSMQTGKCLASS
jgi:hypothetical protein